MNPTSYDTYENDAMRDGRLNREAEAKHQREKRETYGSPSDPPCKCEGLGGEYADASACPAHGPGAPAHTPRITLQRRMRTTPAPPNPRLQVECPQCGAEAGVSCQNYKGQRCHPHGARKLPKPTARPEAAAPVETARPSPAPEPAAPAEAAEPKLSELDAAVEALVKRYTCGSVIDAAWEASHRLFQPGRNRREA